MNEHRLRQNKQKKQHRHFINTTQSVRFRTSVFFFFSRARHALIRCKFDFMVSCVTTKKNFIHWCLCPILLWLLIQCYARVSVYNVNSACFFYSLPTSSSSAVRVSISHIKLLLVLSCVSRREYEMCVSKEWAWHCVWCSQRRFLFLNSRNLIEKWGFWRK